MSSLVARLERFDPVQRIQTFSDRIQVINSCAGILIDSSLDKGLNSKEDGELPVSKAEFKEILSAKGPSSY